MVLLVALLPGALAFIGALAGHLLGRRSAVELERWRHREETMRLMRWAVELAVSDQKSRARAGLTTLTALLDSPMLDPDDVDFMFAIAAEVETAVALPAGGDP
jgi:hypothetical protein